MTPEALRALIRTIPDFPRPGVMFRDVTTLFADAAGFHAAISGLVAPWAGARIDVVVGLEARGFILGGAVADRLGTGFVPIRKQGKLPGTVLSESYALEYGREVMEIHTDALASGARVLVVDDLLATGGTAEAAIRLCRRLGAEVVGCGFVVDLPDLGGHAVLSRLGLPVEVLLAFDGD